MSFLEPEMVFARSGSIGKPIKNGEFIIDDETGELCYKGPNVFGGYAEGFENLKTFEHIEILKTGDLARKDEYGYYYITGRLKRFVKLFGIRINLDDIESILKNKFAGNTFACTGMSDRNLFVWLNNMDLDKKNIIDFISNEVGLHHSVIKVNYIGSFPLTENGKIDYKRLLHE